MSDRKQQYRVEFKASARLATDRTQHNQEAASWVKQKRRRMADNCRRWVSRRG